MQNHTRIIVLILFGSVLSSCSDGFDEKSYRKGIDDVYRYGNLPQGQLVLSQEQAPQGNDAHQQQQQHQPHPPMLRINPEQPVKKLNSLGKIPPQQHQPHPPMLRINPEQLVKKLKSLRKIPPQPQIQVKSHLEQTMEDMLKMKKQLKRLKK